MKNIVVGMPRNAGVASMIAQALGDVPGVQMVPSGMQPRIDVNRYQDHIDVLVNGHRVASRDEASGTITWYPMEGFNESDKGVIERDVFAKVARQPRYNRAQRRHQARAKRRGGK